MDIRKKIKREYDIVSPLTQSPKKEIVKTETSSNNINTPISTKPHVISEQSTTKVADIPKKHEDNSVEKMVQQLKSNQFRNTIKPPTPPVVNRDEKHINVAGKAEAVLPDPYIIEALDFRNENPEFNIIIFTNGDVVALNRTLQSVRLQNYKNYTVSIFYDEDFLHDTEFLDEYVGNANILPINTIDYYVRKPEQSAIKFTNRRSLLLDNVLMRITGGWCVILKEGDRLLTSDSLKTVVDDMQPHVDFYNYENGNVILTSRKKTTIGYWAVARYLDWGIL